MSGAGLVLGGLLVVTLAARGELWRALVQVRRELRRDEWPAITERERRDRALASPHPMRRQKR